MTKKSIRIGIVQAGPVYLDLEKSLEKAEKYLIEAAQQGAELVVFGETWLAGYPAWLDHCPDIAFWDYEPAKKVFARMYQNSVDIKGEEIKFICSLAQKYQISICIGLNERVSQGPGNGTLYNAMLIIGTDGKILNHHRKLMPTYTEKMLYGLGDAHGLQAVETSGIRLGGLICWEHWMPLSRQVLHNSNEHIHVALWPKVHEMHQVASRQYAFEGRCFVVAVGQIMRAKDFPPELNKPDKLAQNPDELVLNGGSCIIGPNGYYVLEPQWDKDQVIVHDTGDLDQIYQERMTLDVSGHYQRRDIFKLDYDNSRR